MMIDDFIPPKQRVNLNSDHDYVWVCAGRQFGRACIGGTRLPAMQMAECWWYGNRDAEDICKDYQITIGQLLEACYFASQYGGMTWRRRWKAWAEGPAFESLWHARYSIDLLPPQKESS